MLSFEIANTDAGHPAELVLPDVSAPPMHSLMFHAGLGLNAKRLGWR